MPVLSVAILAGAGGLLVGRYLLPALTADVKVKVAAEEFCALGDGDGASLLDVSGWVTAAQRVNSDWDAVIAEIDKHCPSWRTQVAAKAADLD
jgi:hypothetical protein